MNNCGLSADRIIFSSLAGLILLGLISFFINPAYEKGVWVTMVAAGNCLTGALGFKFGVSVPSPSTQPAVTAEPTNGNA